MSEYMCQIDASLARIAAMATEDEQVVIVDDGGVAARRRSLLAQGVGRRRVFGLDKIKSSGKHAESLAKLALARDGMIRSSGAGNLWLVCGGVGTGKSTLAVDVAIRGHYASVIFKYADSIWREYQAQRERFGFEGQEYWVRRFAFTTSIRDGRGVMEGCRSNLMVLDDGQLFLYKGAPSEQARRDLLHRIVDDRLSNGLDTLLVGNWELDGLCDVFGDAIMDRIRGAQGVNRGAVYQFTWESLR